MDNDKARFTGQKERAGRIASASLLPREPSISMAVEKVTPQWKKQGLKPPDNVQPSHLQGRVMGINPDRR